MTLYSNRTASLVVTLLGAVVNLAFFFRLLSAPPLKWVPESEWEASGDPWQVGGVKMLWGLLCVYFAVATTVCFVGFFGIIKAIPSFVRFYRDYSIADFSFCAFFTAIGTYAAFRPSLRTGLCEQLSTQPELMRDVAELGLSLENCEMWVERAVLVFMAAMIVLVVIRLHFLIAVSNFYSHLQRHRRPTLPTHHSRDDSRQRIYIIPRLPSRGDEILVYAPVPLSSLSQTEHAATAEAWISRTEPLSSHSPHRHRRSASAQGSTGRISLPVLPGEGLLPAYQEQKSHQS